MAIGDAFKNLGQRLGRGLVQVGGYDPRQQVSAQEAARRRNIGLEALQRSFGKSAAILSGDPQRLAMAQQQEETARKRKLREDFLAKNPQYAQTLRALEAGIPAGMLSGEKRQTYKPELVEYKNTSDKPIKIGNVVVQPGQQMPFNVAIPEIANSISGVPGLKEIKDEQVYTRQGALYTTKDGDYREIIQGSQRIFDGPGGRFDSAQFFLKYPDTRTKTSGEDQRYIPDFKTFTGLAKDLTTDERSMKKISNYFANIKNANIGLERLGDQISQWAKTLAGSVDLTIPQLARSIAEGQLQGMVGANRLDTVGGGVMTEKDAWRVVTRLGGDVDALQNPAVVAQQLKLIYADKARQYNNDILGYNIGVNTNKYEGYTEKEPINEQEILNLFTLLPQGIPSGSKKVEVQGTTLYQLNGKYYAVLPNGTVEEVEID